MAVPQDGHRVLFHLGRPRSLRGGGAQRRSAFPQAAGGLVATCFTTNRVFFLYAFVQHNTMESLLERGEKLDDLVSKSEVLGTQSKAFYKTVSAGCPQELCLGGAVRTFSDVWGEQRWGCPGPAVVEGLSGAVEAAVGRVHSALLRAALLCPGLRPIPAACSGGLLSSQRGPSASCFPLTEWLAGVGSGRAVHTPWHSCEPERAMRVGLGGICEPRVREGRHPQYDLQAWGWVALGNRLAPH